MTNVFLAPATPCEIGWYPLNQPDSLLRITITEDKEGNVHIAGLSIPQEQLDALCEILEVWKYGLVEGEN